MKDFDSGTPNKKCDDEQDSRRSPLLRCLQSGCFDVFLHRKCISSRGVFFNITGNCVSLPLFGLWALTFSPTIKQNGSLLSCSNKADDKCLFVSSLTLYTSTALCSSQAVCFSICDCHFILSVGSGDFPLEDRIQSCSTHHPYKMQYCAWGTPLFTEC